MASFLTVCGGDLDMGVRVNEYFGRLRSYNRRLLSDKDNFLTSPRFECQYGFAEFP